MDGRIGIRAVRRPVGRNEQVDRRPLVLAAEQTSQLEADERSDTVSEEREGHIQIREQRSRRVSKQRREPAVGGFTQAVLPSRELDRDHLQLR